MLPMRNLNLVSNKEMAILNVANGPITTIAVFYARPNNLYILVWKTMSCNRISINFPDSPRDTMYTTR